MTIIRLARIQLLIKVLKKSPPFVIDLLEDTSIAQVGWSSAVKTDLAWLCLSPKYGTASCRFDNEDTPVKCCNMSFSQWCRYLSLDLRGHSNSIKKWCATPVANIVAAWASTPALNMVAEPTYCDRCSVSFDSKQKLYLHMFKKHQIKHPVRRYVDGTHCTICMKEFWSRERLLNHLKYKSDVCRLSLMTKNPILTEVEAVALDDAECGVNIALAKSGRRRHFVQKPCVQLHGPFVVCMMFDADGGGHHPLGAGRQFGPVC